jgi:hypothetical protein
VLPKIGDGNAVALVFCQRHTRPTDDEMGKSRRQKVSGQVARFQ